MRTSYHLRHSSQQRFTPTTPRRIPSSVEVVVASSLLNLAASSPKRANQGTSLTRRFERHLVVMNVDETTEEITARALPEAMHTHGAAGAAPSIASPPKAGSLRPREDQRSPGDAPPRAYSRTSDDEVLNYMSDGAAGAAGASATPCALAQMMDAAVRARPSLRSARRPRRRRSRPPAKPREPSSAKPWRPERKQLHPNMVQLVQRLSQPHCRRKPRHRPSCRR